MRLFLLFILLSVILSCQPAVLADEGIVLKTGVSLNEMVPDKFFGTWRIKSKLLETNANGVFKNDNVDLWNISKDNSVITLDNPFSGARASIAVKEVNGNKIVFEKEGRYNNKLLNDRVELYLDGDSFNGYNYLRLNTVSEIDGRIMDSQTAKYSLYGDKISGYNALIEE